MSLRLYLNLSPYFQDYKQFSKICVDENIKTISDLKEHIAEIFYIRNNFCLACQNVDRYCGQLFYLSESQSIDILDDNDYVHVKPDLGLENVVEAEKIRKKLKKKHKYDEEQELVKNKKHKKGETKAIKNKNTNETHETNESNKETNEQTQAVQPKKKKFKKNVNLVCYETRETNEQSDYVETNETIVDQSSEVCNNVDPITRKRRRCITPLKENHTEIYLKEKLVRNMEESMQTSSNIIIHSNEIITESVDSLTVGVHYRTSAVRNNSNKRLSGVGEILKCLNNDQSDTTNTEIDFITKRKRSRVRKRKNKKVEENVTELENPVEKTVFKPPKTAANPKLHIKFTGDENITQNGFEENSENLAHSTPVKNNNLSLPEVPSVNSKILFKTLKIGENYNPVVSNQIMAEVQNVLSNGAQLELKIIDGLDEFRQPMGRFFGIVEEELPETMILDRSSLIEPKLME